VFKGQGKILGSRFRIGFWDKGDIVALNGFNETLRDAIALRTGVVA